MTPIETVRNQLESRGRWIPPRDDKGHDFIAQCPAHDDGRPSLHVTEGRDGRVLLKCFAGCEPTSICEAIGLNLEDLFPDTGPRPDRKVPAAPARPVEHYVYKDEAGEPLFRVTRMEPKSFRQARWEDGDWRWGLGETRRVLYRLPEVKAAIAARRWVFLVEGEKDVHAVEAAGEVATTMSAGAGKWSDEYTESLAGARLVIIADDDEPGRKHAVDVYRRLFGKAGKVGVRLPAEGFKDIADHLAAGKTLQDLRKAPELEALDTTASSDGNGTGGNGGGAIFMTARAMSARPSPARSLRVVGPLIQRGMRTTIGASTGEGKTTFGLQAIQSLVEGKPFLDESWVPQAGGGRALIIDLEQGEETLKRRLREANLADSDAVDVLWEPAGLALESDPAHQALVRDTIRQGRYDLVLLDPLYQMHRGNSNDERTAADLMRVVDGWAREFGFALLLPMHARKPHPEAGKNMTIHDISGSTGWNRNAEFVIGLQLLSAGMSRAWFFKDRIGDGPEIRKWWGLSFSREEGFARNMVEDKQARRAEARALLGREEGATAAELLKALGGDEVALKSVTKDAHAMGVRLRSRPWHEQTSLSTDDGG